MGVTPINQPPHDTSSSFVCFIFYLFFLCFKEKKTYLSNVFSTSGGGSGGGGVDGGESPFALRVRNYVAQEDGQNDACGRTKRSGARCFFRLDDVFISTALKICVV